MTKNENNNVRGRQNYVENADIMEQWKQWRRTGEVSDTFARQILLIADRILTKRSFSGYARDVKDDMRQEAYIKCHRNLKNFKPDKGTVFSYLTRCCWTAFVTYLAKYYKEKNRQRELIIQALEEAQCRPELASDQYVKNLLRELRIRDEDFNEVKEDFKPDDETDGF